MNVSIIPVSEIAISFLSDNKMQGKANSQKNLYKNRFRCFIYSIVTLYKMEEDSKKDCCNLNFYVHNNFTSENSII
jgi:hypothetical protein